MVIVDDILDDNSDSFPPYASPNPSPARGIYGFALFIVSWFSFALYLIWALLPTPYLKLLHLTYLPAKYWAIAIPLLLPIAVAAFIILVLAHNLIQLHGIFDDIEKTILEEVRELVVLICSLFLQIQEIFTIEKCLMSLT
uniref:RE23670p, putative n=1 Tax=Brugia malayi TaxID=6279 RepID=A0A7I4KLL8_BRUMA